MPDVVIENPVLNSPYAEPCRHFRFGDEGITDEVVEERRRSEYFVPIPATRRSGKQLALAAEWTAERIESNEFVNRVRDQVARWRLGGYVGTTRTTKRLLDYWTASDRERRLFFCQIEALETAIFVHEVASRYGAPWIENQLREAANDANPGLYRQALKMATGSGKTVVMAMLIAWQSLNKVENPQDGRFSDAFLIVAPGITIRDRLRVLLPEEPENYYDARDIVPPELRERLSRAKVHVANYHQFLPRETITAPTLTKKFATGGDADAFKESPDDVARRVLREIGAKRGLVVINDEAHHCYRRRVGAAEERLTGEERREAEQREEEARVWISGLEAIQKRAGIRVVYDLSATPFFLRGSGYSEGTLFPWVISDFSLIDAIESGIVKVPRVPVDDDQMSGAAPTYRELWTRLAKDLPKKGRATDAVGGAPELPAALEGALRSLYGNYLKYYERWQQGETGETPPVFIVVCNNTNVSKLVYDWVAGYERTLPGGSTALAPGALDVFSNVEDADWRARPNTILVDSVQLEAGGALSEEFKRVAAREIEEFRQEYRRRYPGRDADEIPDSDILREVMNTVGKPGRLGEHVRCVISVSMLTEGWDANTVTHVLGVRAFGTQLLCEQVVGRALRRTSYVVGEDGLFPPEYAEVYGVPFSFIPTNGVVKEQAPRAPATLVKALPERESWEIRFPNVTGYRYDLPRERLDCAWAPESKFVLSPRLVPIKTELDAIVGEGSVHDLSDLEAHRPQEVEYAIARLTLERYFRDDEGVVQPWLFPQVLTITRRWIEECVSLEDHAFPQLLLLAELAHQAAERIYRGIARTQADEAVLKPIVNHYNPEGSTRFVQIETRKETYRTKEKCHVSHVIIDSGWEAKLASALEEMPEVRSYVKNQGVNLRIPYTIGGVEHEYIPDFIALVEDGHGPDDPLHLILECSGQQLLEKEAKVETAATLWVPAVNHAATHGRWAFFEVTNPWAAQRDIRGFLSALTPGPSPLRGEGEQREQREQREKGRAG